MAQAEPIQISQPSHEVTSQFTRSNQGCDTAAAKIQAVIKAMPTISARPVIRIMIDEIDVICGR